MFRILEAKKPLYAPMLCTFGGGSSRGFNPGGAGGVAGGLADIFGASTTSFLYEWNNNFTTPDDKPDTSGWSSVPGGYGHFLSFFAPTNITPEDWNTTFNNRPAYLGSGSGQGSVTGGASLFTQVSVTSSSTSYQIGNSIIYDHANAGQGIWFEQNDGRTATFSGIPGAGIANATGFVAGFYEAAGGYHKCLLLKITGNSVARYFAPHHNVVASTSNGNYNIYHFLPLKTSTGIDFGSDPTNGTLFPGTTLPTSHFEWYG